MCLSNGQRHTKKAAALHNLFTHGRLGYFGWIISIVLLNWVKSECRDAQAVKAQLVGQVSVHLKKQQQSKRSADEGNLVNDQEIIQLKQLNSYLL